jgi:hypothetical protein
MSGLSLEELLSIKDILDAAPHVNHLLGRNTYASFFSRSFSRIGIRIRNSGMYWVDVRLERQRDEWVIVTTRPMAPTPHTRAKREFLNRWLPMGWQVTRRDYMWRLRHERAPGFPYRENAYLYPDGRWQGGTATRATGHLRTVIERYIQDYIAVFHNTLDDDGGRVFATPQGECYTCRRENGPQCMAQALGREMDANIFYPALLKHALLDGHDKDRAEEEARPILDGIDLAMQGLHGPHIPDAEPLIPLVERRLRRYMYGIMGFAVD